MRRSNQKPGQRPRRKRPISREARGHSSNCSKIARLFGAPWAPARRRISESRRPKPGTDKPCKEHIERSRRWRSQTANPKHIDGNPWPQNSLGQRAYSGIDGGVLLRRAKKQKRQEFYAGRWMMRVTGWLLAQTTGKLVAPISKGAPPPARPFHFSRGPHSAEWRRPLVSHTLPRRHLQRAAL